MQSYCTCLVFSTASHNYGMGTWVIPMYRTQFHWLWWCCHCRSTLLHTVGSGTTGLGFCFQLPLSSIWSSVAWILYAIFTATAVALWVLWGYCYGFLYTTAAVLYAYPSAVKSCNTYHLFAVLIVFAVAPAFVRWIHAFLPTGFELHYPAWWPIQYHFHVCCTVLLCVAIWCSICLAPYRVSVNGLS